MAEVVPLRDAIDELVRDGDVVALEGFTHLIPHAAGHELIRRGRRDLTLVRMTPDLVYDQMIGAGCARKLTFSWGGNPGVGSLHRFRDAVERSWPAPLELEEHSHAGMAAAYAAGASGLPFGVLRGYAGTDLVGRTPSVQEIDCPFTGERLAAVRALRPDVGIIHAQQADAVRQRPALGHHGRAEGDGARVGSLDRDRRGDRPRARAASRRRDPAIVGDHGGLARTGRRAPLLRTRVLRPRQRVLPRVGSRSAGIASSSRRGSAATCSRPRTSSSTGRACATPSGRSHDRGQRRGLHLRRDDGRRGRAPAAERDRLLRGHRPAEPRGQPGACDACARLRARVRERHDRREAAAPAALDRRRRARRDGRHRRLGARDLHVLAAGGADRRRLPRRGADRPVRQPQQHGRRRLRPSEGAAAGRRWRLRDRDVLPRDVRDAATDPARLRRAARLPHLGRARRRARVPRPAGPAGRRGDRRRHGPRCARARSRDLRARADEPAPRQHRGRRPCRDGVDAPGRRRHHHRRPADRRGAGRACED